MHTLRLFLLPILFQLTVGQFFKYNFYNKTAVSPQSLTRLMIGEPFQLSNRNPSLGCMSFCNMNANCSVVTLDSLNTCAMFTNQTSLVNTVTSSTSMLFSKLALSMCLNSNYYPNMSSESCMPKKFFRASCNSSLECNNLSCVTGLCLCSQNRLLILI
jgi:hypothetical protein